MTSPAHARHSDDAPDTGAPVSAVRAVLALAAVELRLMVRNRLLLFTALVMPLLLGVFLGSTPGVLGPDRTPAVQVVVVLALAVYAGAATALTARRQDGYLRRLRSGEIADGPILGGLLAPLVIVGIVQALVLAAATIAVGLPAPGTPLPAVLGVLLGSVLFGVAGVVTAAMTRRPETAQITTLPLFLVAALGAFLVAAPGGTPSPWVLAVPGAGVAELVRLAWGPGSLASGALAAGATIIWIGLAALLARAVFRWDPRG